MDNVVTLDTRRPEPLQKSLIGSMVLFLRRGRRVRRRAWREDLFIYHDLIDSRLVLASALGSERPATVQSDWSPTLEDLWGGDWEAVP